MVAVGGRFPGDTDVERSALARVSITNWHGAVILDTFVRPAEPITDYRTRFSGVRPSDMKTAMPFAQAQQRVADLLKDRILIGHALTNDLAVLLLSHPRRDIRDTAKHMPFRKKYGNGRSPALRVLAAELLGVEIQGGEHSSVEDARVCLMLYKRFKKEFEEEHRKLWPVRGKARSTLKGGAVVGKMKIEAVKAIDGEESSGDEDGDDSGDEDEEPEMEDGAGAEAEREKASKAKLRRERLLKKKKKRK